MAYLFPETDEREATAHVYEAAPSEWPNDYDERPAQRSSSTSSTSSSPSTRRTPAERSAIAQEALDRATGNHSAANYAVIFDAFTARGIPEADIIPRENVLTFHAWRAKGRTVRKGEKGVPVVTWIPRKDKDAKIDPKTGKKADRGMYPKTAYVFHVTQTDPLS